ncbi:MAG: 16S rRNA (adenine(1518)-N(6)/adenine(1519)-N(6))-dimethyltransferase RsmA [Candidatus Sericytochromatia bacterium]|nr:16S rRNA (adenine(1518)-N(6)/adenine(1519)-N(6))-dimethyltransferase RsmA [Candidatus Sericytochromatia bacterium]
MSPQPPRHRPKHRLGQNFLHDVRVREEIVAAAALSSADTVLEIGPGRGFLTSALLEAGPGRVVAVELDRTLAPYLEPVMAANPQFSLVWGDFLKTPWEALALGPWERTKVVANIPYYITTPILLHLLQAERLAREPLAALRPRAERIILMVQWEVAQRLLAGPGGKDYGSLSLIAQYAADVSLVTRVPAGAFRPRPEVDSAVVMLKPRQLPPVAVSCPAMLSRVIRGAFQQRRKTLQNSLMGAGLPRERLQAAAQSLGLDLGRRAETLSLAEFAALADALGGPAG